MTRPSVLIVDDDEVACVLLRGAFINQGWTIHGPVHDAASARQAVTQHGPDLVLMDVRMPEEDGLEAAIKILAQGPARIVLISQTDPDDLEQIRTEGLAAGVMDVLKKPKGSDETRRLLARCRSLVFQPVPEASGASGASLQRASRAIARPVAEAKEPPPKAAGRPFSQPEPAPKSKPKAPVTGAGPSFLIADDSAIVRLMLQAAFVDAGLNVVGLACDGEEAVNMNRQLKPDLVVMDVKMPRCDGLAALRRMMASGSTRVLLMSGADADELKEMSFDGIAAGALDVIEKPAGEVEIRRLISKSKLLAGVPMGSRSGPGRKGDPRWKSDRGKVVQSEAPIVKRSAGWAPRAVVITASTGGPGTLVTVLKQLPKNYPLPVLIVQHMSPGFDHHFCTWMNHEIALDVRLATDGDRVEAGVVYVAPNDHHLEINSRLRMVLHQGPKESAQRPAGTVLLRSAAKALGSRAVGVVMTGMGDDGAIGLLAMREEGALTIAQDGDSATVDGMPKAARDLDAAEKVADPEGTGQILAGLVRSP